MFCPFIAELSKKKLIPFSRISLSPSCDWTRRSLSKYHSLLREVRCGFTRNLCQLDYPLGLAQRRAQSWFALLLTIRLCVQKNLSYRDFKPWRIKRADTFPRHKWEIYRQRFYRTFLLLNERILGLPVMKSYEYLPCDYDCWLLYPKAAIGL